MARSAGLVVLAGVVAVVTALGASSVAVAALVADPNAAITILAEDTSFSFDKQERQCLVQVLERRPSITRQVVGAAGGLAALPPTTKGAVLGMIARCASKEISRTLDFAPGLFDGEHVASGELRCFVTRLGSLDDDVLATMAGGGTASLSADEKAQVVGISFDCMPTAVGRGMVDQFLKGVGAQAATVTDRAAECVGQGVGRSLVAADRASLVAGGDPPPAFTTALLKTMVRCTPDVMTTALTKSFRSSGAPPKVATCVAKGVVRDEALLEELVAAGTGGGSAAPGVEALVRRCS